MNNEEKILELLQALDAKIDRQKEELTTEINAAERRMQVLMESYFTPRFNLLAENQQIIQEKMATKEDLRDYREEMQAELFILKAAVKRNTMEIEKLKKAQ